jgi:hypothetical protein
MRRCYTPLIILALAGCAAPPEVREASIEVGEALEELRHAQRDFGSAFLEEIEAVRKLIARAIVSDAVNARIAGMVGQAFDGDLIGLSAAMRHERDAALQRVGLVTAKAPPVGADADFEAHVLDTLKSIAPGLRRTAELIESEAPERAAELRAQADRLESDPNAGISDAELGALADLVLLEATGVAVREGLGDLEDYLRFLQLVHRQVDAWLAADVKVEGERLARLIDEHAHLIGLGDGS